MDGCRIGIGRAEITPTEPGPTCGWGSLGQKKATPPEDADQKLFVTAMALEDGAGQRVVLVNADLHCGGARLWRRAAAAAGLDPSQLVLCGTHTHAGPGQRYGGFVYTFATASPFGVGASTRWLASLIGQAVQEAIASLAPGGMAVGRETVTGGGSNRAAPAWFHYDAEQRTAFFASGPGAALSGEPHEADRMRDPRVTVLVAGADDGTVVGVLAWYAVHGTSLGPTWKSFGADLWGVARAEAEHGLGGAKVGFGDGSSGDITPRPMDEAGGLREGEPGGERPDLTQAIGARLGRAVRSLVPTLTPAAFSLGVAHDHWNPRSSGLPSPRWGLAMAGGGVDGPNGSQRWNDVRDGVHAPLYVKRKNWAHATRDGQAPKIDVIAAFSPIRIPLGFVFRMLMPRQLPLHVIRVGDHTFATVAGEPTTMTGWRIEQHVQHCAGTTSASVIGFAGDYGGYWVTPEEYREQRYEAASTIYGRDASTELIARLGELARTVART